MKNSYCSRPTGQAGATLIEYALVAALIAAFCVGIVTAVGGNIHSLYTLICNTLATATAGPGAC